MAGSKTEFEEFLAKEVQETKGVRFPVKTGPLTRMLVKKAPCRSIHPNPEDEFCMPEIGPNYNVIETYQKKFRANADLGGQLSEEPVIVERLYPDGYMIINGHHRWAASLRIGREKIPVRIVNLMHEADIRQMLQNSKHEKRAVFDLDEVLLRSEGDPFLEPPLSFPWNKLYKERVRLGVPALLHFLAKNGYDIWVYSAQFPSADAVQEFFRKYHAGVDAVISAAGKRATTAGPAGKKIEKLIVDKYRFTLHIDNDMILQIFTGKKEVREFELSGAPDAWSQEIIDVVERIEKEAEYAQAQT